VHREGVLDGGPLFGGLQWKAGVGPAPEPALEDAHVDPETPGASYITASGRTYFTPVSAVPETATLFLLGTGFMGLGGIALRRHRRQ
jgi:hypothetical protein